MHRYRFPQGQFRPGTSLFITPVLDVRDPPPTGTCMNTVAYIADVTGYGILVYDARQNRSWRVQNKLIYPHPHEGTFTIAGESFDLMDGVMGLALSPRRQTRGKTFDVDVNYHHMFHHHHPPPYYNYYNYNPHHNHLPRMSLCCFWLFTFYTFSFEFLSIEFWTSTRYGIL